MAISANNYWFFTAPHEPVLIRRGDPLGFRLTADYFADVLVPDLSNRSVDARWFTILSWALMNAGGGWRHYDERDMAVTPGRDRESARQLYEWVRPLELLWVARTLTLTGDDARRRQLPGQRAVHRWLDESSVTDFGLSADQRARYRQTGAYGGYRVALRRLPGLTIAGVGWQPAEAGRQLAAIVDKKIGWKTPHFDKARRRSVERDDFWLNHWEGWNEDAGNDFFPERSDHVGPLPDDEAKVARRVLFGDGEKNATAAPQRNQLRRAQVAEILGGSTATTHAEQCEALSDGLEDMPDDQRKRLSLLPSLTRLADAGIEAMNAVWHALGDDLRVPMAELARDVSLRNALDELRKFASDFSGVSNAGTPGVEVAERFARSLRIRGSAAVLLSALVEHHQLCGGGMRWFVADGGHLTRNAPANRGARVSRYRFRLWGLARLAVQCGQIAKMPQALLDVNDAAVDGGDEE